MSTGASAGYRPLTVDSLTGWLAERTDLASRLPGDPAAWTVSEIGDGNLNLVFRVAADASPGASSVIVKQALPYLRARGEDWPLPLSRAWFEHEALIRQAERAPGMTPEVLHFDRDMALIVMEDLSPHIILRKGLTRGVRYPRVGADLGRFLARTLFRGSDFSLSADDKRADLALFAGNTALCGVTEARVFTEPYHDAVLNRWTSPELDEDVTRIRADSAFKIGIQEMKTIFMTHAETLLHGDLHSGSVMVTEDDTRVIDPEFAFYGPMGFDTGALLANYLVAWCAQPGQANADDDRVAHADWILATVRETWDTFVREFRELWRSERRGELYPADVIVERDTDAAETALSRFLDGVLADTVGFAAAKMTRRVIGAAHVEDLESISDPGRRAARERVVLALARELLLGRHRLSSIDDVVELARDVGKH